MKQFRQGSIRVLITTDLLARGIDVQQVGCVINYELPYKKENYVHRIKRAGRFGKKGTAINFVLPKDTAFIKEIEEHFNCKIDEMLTDLDELWASEEMLLVHQITENAKSDLLRIWNTIKPL